MIRLRVVDPKRVQESRHVVDIPTFGRLCFRPVEVVVTMNYFFNSLTNYSRKKKEFEGECQNYNLNCNKYIDIQYNVLGRGKGKMYAKK